LGRFISTLAQPIKSLFGFSNAEEKEIEEFVDAQEDLLLDVAQKTPRRIQRYSAVPTPSSGYKTAIAGTPASTRRSRLRTLGKSSRVTDINEDYERALANVASSFSASELDAKKFHKGSDAGDYSSLPPDALPSVTFSRGKRALEIEEVCALLSRYKVDYMLS
jgi:hypothetical protein